ncbi:MAG: hypothetical protein M1514_03505 [Patescibacteria group bacterium]|nr:hypothetical protein [Patescibacteria group bacterium]
MNKIMDQTLKDMQKMKDMMKKTGMEDMTKQMDQEMDHMKKMKDMMMQKQPM